jgi:hypothetical protein
MNRERLFAIKLDPSGTGDIKENTRLRDTSCQMCGWPHAQGKDQCEKCVAREHSMQRQRMRDFNLFFHGCSDPVHVHNVGWVDPSTREGKRYLDP